MENALSVDVEDYFQVRSFASFIPRSAWDSCEHRYGRATRGILELLGRFDVKGTFFVLGWNAERDPQLVKEISRAGHEVASHGWDHTLVYQQDESQFRRDVGKTKSLLEDISGAPVVGYRAASYSITSRCLWALEVLAETGYLYDSSIYPIRRGTYGIASEKREPHLRGEGRRRIAEFPMSTARVGAWNVPFASGAYLRAAPLWLTRALIGRLNSSGIPAIVSVHPWELDPSQPRVCSFLRRPNHYLNLKGTRLKLEILLGLTGFFPLKHVLDTLGLLSRG
jgi:polysaccharide deacetylase family protein (PEP-CTERM system associated)